MKKSLIILIAPLLVAWAFEAKSWEKQVDESSPEGGVRSQLVETTSTVESIDQKERLVTLKDEDTAEVSTLKVDESVKNLNKVKKGDRVKMQYYEAVAWDVIKKKYREDPAKTVFETKTSSEPGKKPEGQMTRQVRLIADIQKIDRNKPSVTLKGPEGNTKTIIVRHPENLKGVKVGDQVDITYTEALAVSVEKASR